MKRFLGLILTGMALTLLAVLVSNASIERVLLGDATRSLSWGATLFRALLAAHGMVLVAVGIIWGWRALWSTERSQPTPQNFARASNRQTSVSSWLMLIALSLVALALRLWRLNTDLWVDEVFTLLDFVRVPLGEIVTSFPNQNQHMLLSLLSHGSVNIFGESAWALRLPSVMFGVASLWALFLLGRSIIGRREALLAAALMTVSYHHVWFSQNARGYMGLLFFTLLATWFWIEASRRDSWAWWLGYVVAVSLGMWIHMTMAFVVAAHAFVYLGELILSFRDPAQVNQRREVSAPEANTKARNIFSLLIARAKLKPIFAWLLCGSVTLQLYALALPEFLQLGFHEESLESEWTSPLWVIAETVRNLRLGGGALVGLAGILGGLALTGAGWISLLRRDGRSACALVLPALLAGTAMLALGHNLWPRFFFFSMGFGILIVVHGAMVLTRGVLARLFIRAVGERWGQRVGLALACLLITASAVTLPKNYLLPKQDFSGARDYVELHRRPGEGVVAVGLAGVMYGRYFAPEWSVAQTQAELDAVWRGHSATWLVYTLPIEVRVYRPEVWHVISQDFEVVKIFPGTLGGGEVYVCRQRTSSDARPKFLNVSSLRIVKS